jgi:hypothetical protein
MPEAIRGLEECKICMNTLKRGGSHSAHGISARRRALSELALYATGTQRLLSLIPFAIRELKVLVTTTVTETD